MHGERNGQEDTFDSIPGNGIVVHGRGNPGGDTSWSGSPLDHQDHTMTNPLTAIENTHGNTIPTWDIDYDGRYVTTVSDTGATGSYRFRSYRNGKLEARSDSLHGILANLADRYIFHEEAV